MNTQQVHWYGYIVDDGWFHDGGKLLLEGDLSSLSPRELDDRCKRAVIALLAKATGIKTLTIKLAFPLGCIPQIESSRFYPMLAVCGYPCRGGLRNRPLQSQLNRLTKYMGYEPEWFVDAMR